MTPRTEAPADNARLRAALYAGEIFRLPATAASRAAAEEAAAAIERELGPDPRRAQFRMTNEEFFAAAGRLRKGFFASAAFRDHARAIFTAAGFDPARTAFDPFKLRAVTHNGFENPAAAAVYYAHRDTWYAQPRCLVNWWVPLHDVTEDETFAFFPGDFARAVGNDSESFDYGESALGVGWQDVRHGLTRLYPRQVGEPAPGEGFSFPARFAEVVLFSGAHLHQTRRNVTGRTRFSLDFRTADLADHAAGLGAPDVDNRSRGCALADYVHPSAATASTAAAKRSSHEPDSTR